MNKTKTLWLTLGCTMFVAFFILGWFGRELYRQVPPIPRQVISQAGEIITTKDDILRGQQVWQSIGGQQVGSIWGHGAYQAPDWSADWLHRESVALRNLLSIKHYSKRYKDLPSPQQAAVRERLKTQMRANTYDNNTQTVTVSEERAAAIADTANHYNALFVLRVLLGALTAHYTIEGDSFFGIPLARILPYAVTRTWHIQLAVFWIATAFLAAGLYLAPAVGGREPRFQRFGVNVLFVALVAVVGGSLAGEWLSVQQVFDLDTGFWFGHRF